MSRKNYGMKMTEEDIKAKITENKQRLVRQQEGAKKRQDVSTFFTRISHFYDYLKHRLTNPLCYVRFCLILNARYCFESRSKTAGHRLLSPATILGYFKREMGELEMP